MAWRLGEYVACGELCNTRNYSTTGALLLRGPGSEETTIHFQLTGNCDSELNRKHIRFSRGPDSPPIEKVTADYLRDFQIRHVGPTGTMQTQGWVRTFSCSVKEFTHRSSLGEPPPTKWTRLLYLEWYSQNGRVVIELPGATVEECVREPNGEDDEGEWRDLPNLALPPAFAVGAPPGFPSITIVEGDSHTDIDEETMQEIAEQDTNDDSMRAIDELRLFDECLAQHEDEPIIDIAPDLENLPEDEGFTDAEVEAKLKDALMRLALLGIALDVCEHYTPRDSYRYLRNEILPQEKSFRRMIGTGYVQHFSTWEACAKCDAELNEQYGKEFGVE